MKQVGKISTAIQFFLIGALFWEGPMITLGNGFFLTLQAVGFAIGIWAIGLMGIFNVSIYPIPQKGMKLRVNGPYRWIRHPMYLAVMLFMAPIASYHPTIVKSILLLFLAVDLVIKIAIEENLLQKEVDGYNDYMKSTWRIIPFVF